MFNLSSLYPIHFASVAVSSAVLSFCKYWQGPQLKARIVASSCDSDCRSSHLVEAIPRWLQPFYYRLRSLDEIAQITENRFLKDIDKFDAAYLWPGVSLETFEQVRKLGKPIVLERINTEPGQAKQILDDAYNRLGLPPQHPITPELIEKERAELGLSDLIFCPSPEGQKSFEAAGAAPEKLVIGPYGWSPERFAGKIPAEKPPSEIPTFLFLGSVCVRKGVHLLLRAWSKAGIKGRLIIFGEIEPAIAQTCGHFFDRPDVIHREYSLDYTHAYREADIFVFPSLEEGSPLVVYEAMAHALPILASPMGGGGIVRDGIDGQIIPPYDEEAWIAALQNLAQSYELQRQWGESSRQRIDEFTWEKVARRREKAILEKVRL